MTTYTRLWLAAGSVIALSFIGLISMGILFRPSIGTVPAVLSIIAAQAAYRHRARLESGASRIAVEIVHGVSLFGTISFAGALASYAIAARTSGWQDDRVVALDRALGFDWLALYRLYSGHPLLTALGRTAYLSISFTPVLLIAALVLLNRRDVLERFLVAFSIALGLTLAIFVFFPMQSAFAHLLNARAGYLPISQSLHIHVIESLRSGTATAIDPIALIGIITFPSFHTACGVLFAWAAWSVRVYRVPMLLLNGALIAATPIEGAHYLTDLLGGTLVAIVAIGACRVRLRQPARRLPSRPAPAIA